MKFKEKKHAYLQKRALDKAIYKLIGDCGNYYCTYFIDEYRKNIVFKFENSKYHPGDKTNNDIEKIEFNLPSIEEIISVAKKIYKNFDDSDIKNIEYNFSYFGYKGWNSYNKPKDLILNANGSNINLDYSIFNSIKIDNANNVYIDSRSLSDIKVKSKLVCLQRSNYELNDLKLQCEIIKLNSVGSLYAKNINFKASEIDLDSVSSLNAGNVILKAKTIKSKKNFYDSENEISGQKIVICADNIDIKDRKLKAIKEVIIQNKSCTPIQYIESPKIIYNGKDISNNDEIVIQKLRKKLLHQLKNLRYNINNQVDNLVEKEVESYKKKLETHKEKLNKYLNNKPITKILKK